MVGVMFVLSAALAGSPSVYKCKDANGVVVFSQQPCGKDAQTVDTSAALRVPSDTGASMTEALSHSVDKSQLEIDCANRRDNAARSYGAELNGIDAQIRALRRSKLYSNDNNAGQTRDLSIETQISGLETRRSSITTAITQQQMAIDSDCAAKRDALAKSAQPAPQK